MLAAVKAATHIALGGFGAVVWAATATNMIMARRERSILFRCYF